MFLFKESDVPLFSIAAAWQNWCHKVIARDSKQLCYHNRLFFPPSFLNNGSSRWHVAETESITISRVPRRPSKFLCEEFVGGIWIVKAREHLLPAQSHYH